MKVSVSTKKQPCSLSLEEDLRLLLDDSAKKIGTNRSDLVRQLIVQYLDNAAGDDDEVPITIKVPVHLKDRGVDIKRLVNKHFDLVSGDGEEIPIIIKVPSNLKKQETNLKEWLRAKTDAIAKALLTS